MVYVFAAHVPIRTVRRKCVEPYFITAGESNVMLDSGAAARQHEMFVEDDFSAAIQKGLKLLRSSDFR